MSYIAIMPCLPALAAASSIPVWETPLVTGLVTIAATSLSAAYGQQRHSSATHVSRSKISYAKPVVRPRTTNRGQLLHAGAPATPLVSQRRGMHSSSIGPVIRPRLNSVGPVIRPGTVSSALAHQSTLRNSATNLVVAGAFRSKSDLPGRGKNTKSEKKQAAEQDATKGKSELWAPIQFVLGCFCVVGTTLALCVTLGGLWICATLSYNWINIANNYVHNELFGRTFSEMLYDMNTKRFPSLYPERQNKVHEMAYWKKKAQRSEAQAEQQLISLIEKKLKPLESDVQRIKYLLLSQWDEDEKNKDKD